MRKIQTQANIDKKKRKDQIVIGVVMISLLVISTLGYSLVGRNNEEDSSVQDFGIEFFYENGFWKTVFDDNIFVFKNLPSEVSDIDVNISVSLGQYSGQVLYFVNPNAGASEILNNIGGYIVRYQEACINDDDGCNDDFPMKNCDSNLIIFENGNSSKVYQNDSCVFIVGDPLRATDAFLYKVLQII